MSSSTPLDAATWSRVGDLLDEALAIEDREARSLHVARSCGGDTQLHDEVLSLLAAGDSGVAALPSTRWVELQTVATVPDAVEHEMLVGQRLGAWRVDVLLAIGGMGAVYRASRADDSFEKTVAIKVLPHAFANAALVARFDAERRILATLDHPGIARLIDGGHASDGTLWLAMEYVEGVAVDLYCDHRQRTLEKRLHLFVAICNAVQFAHQHLVVHRDLKPSNILVNADGGVKLLDFGIADLSDGGRTVSDGASGEMLAMTPLWASPEQLSGELVTTTSDIYSLGTLLYRLLTAQMPYSSVTKAAQAHDDPPLPSVRLAGTTRSAATLPTPPYTATALRGDLDAIVVKAMQRKPE